VVYFAKQQKSNAPGDGLGIDGSKNEPAARECCMVAEAATRKKRIIDTSLNTRLLPVVLLEKIVSACSQ
jgi:RNA 3'-terminal phosphate cyclase